MLPAALSFALLGAIESLLSAVVADGMTGRRHRSNCELVAQGVANIASALFGGICVTGTIARTATNVRAGARGPVSGMLHALFLLLFMLVAAPLARYIPLAALAAVLAVVAWNMAEKHEFATLLRASRGDAVVLLATFLLVVFRDLTEGIVVGFGSARSCSSTAWRRRWRSSGPTSCEEDLADSANGNGREPYDAGARDRPRRRRLPDLRRLLLRRGGDASARRSTASAEHPKAYVIDFSAVPVLDSHRARPPSRASCARRAARARRSTSPARAGRSGACLLTHGVRPPRVRFKPTIADAIASAHDRSEMAVATPRPTPRDLVLLADPGLVGEPELYVVGIDALVARDRRHAGGETS